MGLGLLLTSCDNNTYKDSEDDVKEIASNIKFGERYNIRVDNKHYNSMDHITDRAVIEIHFIEQGITKTVPVKLEDYNLLKEGREYSFLINGVDDKRGDKRLSLSNIEEINAYKNPEAIEDSLRREILERDAKIELLKNPKAAKAEAKEVGAKK